MNTATSASGFIDGFLAGERCEQCPENASPEFQEGYSRGYELAQFKAEQAEKRDGFQKAG